MTARISLIQEKTRGHRPRLQKNLFACNYRVHLDRVGFRIQRPRNRDFLAREFLRHFLIAERESILSVVENERSAVCIDTGESALGVRCAHPHAGVITVRTHAVGDRSGELPFGLCRREGGNDNQT